MSPAPLALLSLSLLGAPGPTFDGGEPDAGGPPENAGALGVSRWEAHQAAPSAAPPAPADAGELEGVSTAQPPPAVAEAAPSALDFATPTSARFYGNLRSRLGIAPHFDSLPGDRLAQNVADLRSWLLLGGEALFGDRFKAVAEVRVRHRAVEERSPPGQPFLLVNGENAKATVEVEPGEAYVDWYSRWADFRFGNQILTFGANAQGAPADVLNPLDLREGVFFNDPTDVRLPVLAARARGDVLGFGWTVALVPFFQPDRFDLTGQNEALIQPGLGATPPLPPLDRSVEDRAEQPLIETQRPRDLPQYGDLGLRITHKLPGGITIGADYAYTREKLPEVVIDPELARFISEGPSAPFKDPATALSLSQRYGAGEQLLVGSYPRYQVGELEGSALWGPVQVDADVGFSPSRLYVDANFNPVFHPTYSGALTVSDARGTNLILACSAEILYVLDIPQGERVLFVDLPHAEDHAHNTYGAGLVGLAGYRLLQDRLDLESRIFFDARQLDRAVGVRATWNFTDKVHGTLGGEFFGGPLDSPLGYFHHDDQLYAEVRLDL